MSYVCVCVYRGIREGGSLDAATDKGKKEVKRLGNYPDAEFLLPLQQDGTLVLCKFSY